ncbi:MAG: DNA-directed RNA polymerase subunit beta, partial [Christensenellaceae bacterium]|nr:DNA-directed RNA polymerase subunit beta [Christensenellaceae bacterium]
MVHDVIAGKTMRKSFSQIRDVLDVPDLIGIQTESYKQFLTTGLREVLEDISPIMDYSENLVLEFVDYYISDKPKYEVEECKERDVNYAAPLKMVVRLNNKETGEVKVQEVFMGDIPLMTDKGTFIINGAERVIVSQLVRSPGAYYATEKDKTGKDLFMSTLIPNRGAWLEFETDSNDCMWVRVDRTRKLPATVLLRAMGLGSNEEIIEYFGENPLFEATFKKDTADDQSKGLIEIYKRLRPGEPPTAESARMLIEALFFDPKRYDLARVGRYKFNKKLSLAKRIAGQVAAENVFDPETGEVLVMQGETISEEIAEQIQHAGILGVTLAFGEETHKVIGNQFVNAAGFLPFAPEEANLNELVYYPVLKELLEGFEGDEEELKEMLKANTQRLIPKHIIEADMFAAVSYLLGLGFGLGHTDDIDHLGNRRIRSVGELLQNQMRVGLSRLERVVRERMSIQDMDMATPSNLINIRPVTAAIKEFFGSSQLSQFMDQTNPLAELTHKRRLSALGPGGLNRERASFEVRDVHHSHYGRMCPIETPEGPNIGLIGSLSTYARVNQYGFIESPYRVINNGQATDEIRYMTADEEDKYIVAQANELFDEDNRFVNQRILCRERDQFVEVSPDRVDLIDVSPRQLVSVATGMIPFLENDDANRALMGSNMQRQAVPLLIPERPFVGTGMEYKAAYDSGVLIKSKEAGTVKYVDAAKIVIESDEDGSLNEYHLIKYSRSNQGTCINQLPLVKKGEKIEKGQVIA